MEVFTMKSIIAFLAALMVVASAVFAADLDRMDFNRFDQVTPGQAMEIADRIPYVNGFGTLESIAPADDNGRPVWDIVERASDGSTLNVFVDANSGDVSRVESSVYESSNGQLGYQAMHDLDWVSYGSGYAKTDFDLRVTVTSAQAQDIAKNIAGISDAGSLDRIELISNHGVPTWQMVYGPDEGNTVVRVNARDGTVTRVSDNLLDVLQADE
jgi:uncharacterized membrane protein YkoI